MNAKHWSLRDGCVNTTQNLTHGTQVSNLLVTIYLPFNNEEIVVIEVLDSGYDKVAGVFTTSEGVCRINMHRNQKLTTLHKEKNFQTLESVLLLSEAVEWVLLTLMFLVERILAWLVFDANLIRVKVLKSPHVKDG